VRWAAEEARRLQERRIASFDECGERRLIAAPGSGQQSRVVAGRHDPHTRLVRVTASRVTPKLEADQLRSAHRTRADLPSAGCTITVLACADVDARPLTS